MQRRNTRQRQMVLEAVRGRCDHPTADDVYISVRMQDPRVSRATVYRNLHLLADDGQIRSVPTPSGEHFDLRCDDHAHMLCCGCGAVADAAIESDCGLNSKVQESTGWRIIGHETLFSGFCPKCSGGLGAN